MSEEDICDGNHFPWEHVEAARNDAGLQGRNSVVKAKERYLAQAKPCPQCNASADVLQWFYFTTPAKSWEMLWGRAGWMTVCDKCHRQVDFFMELMN